MNTLKNGLAISMKRKIIRGINWIFVIGLVVFGLVLSVTLSNAGLALIVAGTLISPFINDWLKEQFHINYTPRTKMIVILFSFVLAIASLKSEPDENLFLVRFLIQTVGLDEENKEHLGKLKVFFEREDLKKRKKAYFVMREKLHIQLDSLFQNGYYQEVISQGTPYVQFDLAIKQWVQEAKNQLKQQKIEVALKKVPQLMKAGQYREVYHLAVPLEVPELQKYVVKAKQRIDKEIKQLQSWYERGRYKNVIETGTPYAEGDCRVKRLVNDAKKARAKREELKRIKKISQKVSNLIRARKYTQAIQLASQSKYSKHPQLQPLIKKAQFRLKKAKEKKILARLRNISPLEIGENLREYTNLIKLSPYNEKYQRKLKYYKKRLEEKRKQPPLVITQEEYGDKWPFTVNQGKLECFPPGIVTFRANEETYAMNELASSRGYSKIDDIRKEASNQSLSQHAMVTTKVALTTLTEKGLSLCNPASP